MRHILFIFLIIPCLLAGHDRPEKHLFAVHATDVFPEDGILHAGYGKPDEIPAGFPNVRCTVHFSIGELVRPVGDWMSWEDKTYAIVTPLKVLLPQLVNLNCYDTFILGDLDLTEDMFLVAPRGTAATGSFKLFEYDSRTTLREAVDACIASQGGWKVTMTGENIDEEYAPAFVGENNINTHEFFAPFLIEIPHLSLGCRWDSLHGEAWRLANLEMMLVSLFKNPESFTSDDWEELNEHRSVIEKTYLHAPRLSRKSKKMLKKRMLQSLPNLSLKADSHAPSSGKGVFLTCSQRLNAYRA